MLVALLVVACAVIAAASTTAASPATARTTALANGATVRQPTSLAALEAATTAAATADQPLLRAMVGGDGGFGGRRSRSLQSLRGFYQRRMLYCRSGYNLQILSDGVVNGTSGSSKYSVLRFYTTASSFLGAWLGTSDRPRVSVRGEASHLWLCMSSRGILYGSPRRTDECEFYEDVLDNYYNTYYSAKYLTTTRQGTRRWYVAIDSDGRPRSGLASRWRHRMSQFLPRSLYVDEYNVPPQVNAAPPTQFPLSLSVADDLPPPPLRRVGLAHPRRKSAGSGESPAAPASATLEVSQGVDGALKSTGLSAAAVSTAAGRRATHSAATPDSPVSAQAAERALPTNDSSASTLGDAHVVVAAGDRPRSSSLGSRRRTAAAPRPMASGEDPFAW